MNLKISNTIGNGVKNFIAWLKSDSISKKVAEGKPLKEMIAEKVNAMKEKLAEKKRLAKEKKAKAVEAAVIEKPAQKKQQPVKSGRVHVFGSSVTINIPEKYMYDAAILNRSSFRSVAGRHYIDDLTINQVAIFCNTAFSSFSTVYIYHWREKNGDAHWFLSDCDNLGAALSNDKASECGWAIRIPKNCITKADDMNNVDSAIKAMRKASAREWHKWQIMHE